RHRLEAAIELWKQYRFPVCRGDLVDDLPGLLAAAPAHVTLVLLQSVVMPYVSPERRKDFVKMLCEFSVRRKVIWISNESPGALAHIEAVAPKVDRLQGLIGRTILDNGIQSVKVLAKAQAHGAELEWLNA